LLRVLVVDLLGIKMIGVTAENGRKLLISVVLVGAVVLANVLLRAILRNSLQSNRMKTVRFWVRQVWHLVTAVVVVVALISLWFDNPQRLTTVGGLVAAGVAFALQKVVTALAGYVVLMRGKVFSVGDRIVMGGVRGDVIEMSFTQTRIMEMGQPPNIKHETDPAMWVESRQYTGRIVSVSNARIFDEPVYNYTHEFPYIWEEIRVPIPYEVDRARVEKLLLDVAARNTRDVQDMSEDDRGELKRRYFMDEPDTNPHVYWRMTDNWLELTVRFLCKERGVRRLKDTMTREILAGLDEAGIGIASSTFVITGLPPLKLQVDSEPRPRREPLSLPRH
jgi:small-conductance mechanosensitive channel